MTIYTILYRDEWYEEESVVAMGANKEDCKSLLRQYAANYRNSGRQFPSERFSIKAIPIKQGIFWESK